MATMEKVTEDQLVAEATVRYADCRVIAAKLNQEQTPEQRLSLLKQFFWRAYELAGRLQNDEYHMKYLQKAYTYDTQLRALQLKKEV